MSKHPATKEPHQKKVRPYLKNFGKGFFFFPFTRETMPSKEENKWGHRGFVQGAIIGTPVWAPITAAFVCVVVGT